MYSKQVYYEATGKYHVFLARMLRRKKLTFCLLAMPDNKSKDLDDFVRLSGLSITNITFSKIDNHDGYKLLQTAKDRDYRINENIIFDRFGLEHIFPRHNNQREDY